MKRTLPLFFLLFGFITALTAQQAEQVTPLKINPQLYYTTQRFHQNHNEKYLVDNGNTVVTTDTLSLPFVDDFSKNRTRSFMWLENHTTDTFYNVYGGCLANEGITLNIEPFMHDTAWYYSFDTTSKTVDSVAKPAIAFTYFGSNTANCFSNTPQTVYYWPIYYTYTWDSASGKPRDSVQVSDPNSGSSRHVDTLYYAPVVYFAQGENGTLWFDNYAYVNNTYPINPPTIGVATLDGLDQYGQPYNNSSTSTYGVADYLTSKPINLSGLSPADSLYLSFFYEPEGNGDYPDLADSLILEFRDIGGVWHEMWADSGYSNPDSVPQYFQQVLVNVPDMPIQNSFYYGGFQFRFKNYASLYGSNNHWHIDYVKLNKNRSAVDTVVRDIAFVYPFPTILKNYTQEPADQVVLPDDLAGSILLPVHNLSAYTDTPVPTVPFEKYANELYPVPTVVQHDTSESFLADPTKFVEVNPAAEYTGISTASWPVDSLVISANALVRPSDNLPQNDTVTNIQRFSSIMAYDDGSAEKAYGLTGVGVKKFAYEFDLNKPDTLAGFQVMFAQVEGNVSSLVFNFNAWDSLRLNDYLFTDAPVFSMVNQTPYYIDSVNGFTTYVLDTPMIVSNKIYFGWTQTDERRLQIGYDVNSTQGRPHMYIYAGGIWKATSVDVYGSP
ncbi:MAG TPA: hypothetical protein VG603_01740, partial [Chitinophagales bacterium]|nr:hypothetical protein [Chitinophagales bacterium]